MRLTILSLFICSIAFGQDSLSRITKGTLLTSSFQIASNFRSMDTSKVVMLVSKKEVHSGQGFVSVQDEVFCTNYGVAYTIRGYAVAIRNSFEITYLDDNKKPIKNLIVWMSFNENRLKIK